MINIKIPAPINGTYISEGHYFCSKCHKMLGFPHPEEELGIWRWTEKKELQRLFTHTCSDGSVIKLENIDIHEADGSIVNPIFICSKCHKKVMVGGVTTGIPDYWVCGECRGKMKKIKVTRTIYEDGYIEVGGGCDFCGSFPCAHVKPSGEFDMPYDLTAMIAEIEHNATEDTLFERMVLARLKEFQKVHVIHSAPNERVKWIEHPGVAEVRVRKVRCCDCRFEISMNKKNELGDGLCSQASKTLVGYFRNRHASRQPRICTEHRAYKC